MPAVECSTARVTPSIGRPAERALIFYLPKGHQRRHFCCWHDSYVQLWFMCAGTDPEGIIFRSSLTLKPSFTKWSKLSVSCLELYKQTAEPTYDTSRQVYSCGGKVYYGLNDVLLQGEHLHHGVLHRVQNSLDKWIHLCRIKCL